jgi:hypothetical protein
MTINSQRMALRFQERTGCSAATAQKKTQQYIWHSAQQLLRHHKKDAGSSHYIDQTTLQNTLQDVKIKGQRHYVWKTFQSFPERIFSIRETGSNLTERLTMADTNYSWWDIMQAAGTPEQLAVEIYRPFAQQIQRDEFDLVPIHMSSLNNYIRSNRAHDRDAPQNRRLAQELDHNLKCAQAIQLLAEANDNCLMQVRSESTFGRRYYRGANLQNTPRIVRHAALGNCHEYDIESSVFAWKLSWFRAICAHVNHTQAMPATLEYLDHKQALRRRLAQSVFDTEANWAVSVIKELITAIGFGAPARAQGYQVENRFQKPALATIITARSRLDRALADAWLTEFIQEQKHMNDVIVAMGRVNGLDQEWRSIPELQDRAGRLRPNSVIAYLYQSAEREILDWAENFCAESEVLLTVHDCIYTRRPVRLADFRSGIQAFGEFYRLEHTSHQAWTWQDPVLPTDPFYDPRDDWVNRRNLRWDHSRTTDLWTGAGHDGSQAYDPELDPWLDSQ